MSRTYLMYDEDFHRNFTDKALSVFSSATALLTTEFVPFLGGDDILPLLHRLVVSTFRPVLRDFTPDDLDVFITTLGAYADDLSVARDDPLLVERVEALSSVMGEGRERGGDAIGYARFKLFAVISALTHYDPTQAESINQLAKVYPPAYQELAALHAQRFRIEQDSCQLSSNLKSAQRALTRLKPENEALEEKIRVEKQGCQDEIDRLHHEIEAVSQGVGVYERRIEAQSFGKVVRSSDKEKFLEKLAGQLDAEEDPAITRLKRKFILRCQQLLREGKLHQFGFVSSLGGLFDEVTDPSIAKLLARRRKLLQKIDGLHLRVSEQGAKHRELQMEINEARRREQELQRRIEEHQLELGGYADELSRIAGDELLVRDNIAARPGVIALFLSCGYVEAAIHMTERTSLTLAGAGRAVAETVFAPIPSRAVVVDREAVAEVTFLSGLIAGQVMETATKRHDRYEAAERVRVTAKLASDTANAAIEAASNRYASLHDDGDWGGPDDDVSDSDDGDEEVHEVVVGGFSILGMRFGVRHH